jgi:hypothetical protein
LLRSKAISLIFQPRTHDTLLLDQRFRPTGMVPPDQILWSRSVLMIPSDLLNPYPFVGYSTVLPTPTAGDSAKLPKRLKHRYRTSLNMHLPSRFLSLTAYTERVPNKLVHLLREILGSGPQSIRRPDCLKRLYPRTERQNCWL